MFKSIYGVVAICVVGLLIFQPEWLKVFFAIFGDFIQANE